MLLSRRRERSRLPGAGRSRIDWRKIYRQASTRIGLASRNPCTRSQPMRRSSSSSALVSTPSATTRNPSCCASVTIARTMAPFPDSPSKEDQDCARRIGSILRVSIGSCWRYLSEEYPVPKSSIADLIPKARSCARRSARVRSSSSLQFQ